MLQAIQDGFLALRRSWGLAVLLLVVNVMVAALLAVPLAERLTRDLENSEAASNMMYGFDYPWWSHWSERQPGWARGFGPGIFGAGFAFQNLDLLLRGQIPAGLFARPLAEAAGDGVDGVTLGLGLLYLLLQTFLAGGVLGALRNPQGSWTVRGLLHGSSFYFGRFLRLTLLVLVAAWIVFQLNAPFARWADRQAAEAVSGRTALYWTVGRNAVLLLMLLFLNMVAAYAKIVVVVEERSSAILAYLSALSFCSSRLLTTLGHYLALVLCGAILVVAWHALDSRWDAVGYKTQLLSLLLAQSLVLARIGLRVAMWGGQLALYRRSP
jgi:hypothetical protein